MFRTLLLSLAIALPLLARDNAPTPLMRTADPRVAVAGDIVTVTGDYLSKDLVLEVYLSDRTVNTKVTILEQSATTLKFRVPSVKPGKYWFVVLANAAEPVLLEEPCGLIVEETKPLSD